MEIGQGDVAWMTQCKGKGRASRRMRIHVQQEPGSNPEEIISSILPMNQGGIGISPSRTPGMIQCYDIPAVMTVSIPPPYQLSCSIVGNENQFKDSNDEVDEENPLAQQCQNSLAATEPKLLQKLVAPEPEIMVVEESVVNVDLGLRWHLLPERKENIRLPVRKPTTEVFNERTVRISTNHFPLKITLPEEIYMYAVEVERLISDRNHMSAEISLKHMRMSSPKNRLPKRILQKILKCATVYLTQHYERTTKQKIGIASDFGNSFYATKKLESIGLVHSLDMSQLEALGINDPDPGEVESGTFSITLVGTDWEINIPELAKYVNNTVAISDPAVLKQSRDDLPAVYNAVIKAMPNYNYMALGRSLLIRFPPEGTDGFPLKGGLTCWPGISACITPGWKPYLNVELAYSTMRIGASVLETLEELFDGDDVTDVTEWDKRDLLKGTHFLRTAKVTYSPRRFVTRGGTIQRIHHMPPCDMTFFKQGRKITIQHHFWEEYKLKLKYPRGPLLVLSENVMVPAELCKIKSGQSVNRKLSDTQTQEMVKIARKQPNQLKNDIMNEIHKLNLNGNELFTKFGVRTKDRMLELQCRVLDAPIISFGVPGNGYEIQPENGVWSLKNRNTRFIKPALEEYTRNWGICMIDKYDVKNANAIRTFTNAIVKAGRYQGLYFSSQAEVKYCWINPKLTVEQEQHKDNVKLLKQILLEFRDKNSNLVIVVLPDKGTRLYGQVKQVAELAEHGIGLMTHCIIKDNFSPNPKFKMAITPSCALIKHMILKINSKLDGVNHCVALPPSLKGMLDKIDIFNSEESVLILGADVTHPQPDSGIKDPNNPNVDIPMPSFAAVTGTLDKTCMPHMMRAQAQKRAGKGAAEVIANLHDTVYDMILQFYRRNKSLPGNILYYRDGVGDGQFIEVLDVELRGIRAACTRFDGMHRGVPYQPRITFITVQKAHKTRFFMHGNEGVENAPPGTVVDSHIVHPKEIDFYLLSHQAVQGTSRPTHYHVLWNDSDYTVYELQYLTYLLCHMYVRCNHSVKVPASTYYAHWAATRAKDLAMGCDELYKKDLGPLNQKIQREQNFIQKFPMHFI